MCGYHRVEETWTRPRDTWPGVLIHERRCPRCGDYERTETLDEGV